MFKYYAISFAHTNANGDRINEEFLVFDHSVAIEHAAKISACVDVNGYVDVIDQTTGEVETFDRGEQVEI